MITITGDGLIVGDNGVEVALKIYPPFIKCIKKN